MNFSTNWRLALLFLAVGSISWGQQGDSYFDKQDYYNASKNYEREALTDSSKYLNLAQSYFALKDFKAATAALEKYQSGYPDGNKELVTEWLELLSRNDDPVEVINMGTMINTENPDYYPCISRDGQTLYYVSNDRNGGLGGEDVWLCEMQEDGYWGKPLNFRQLNTKSHEGLQSISGDGNFAVVFGNYAGSFGKGDLFYSVKTDEGWSMPCNLGGNINTEYWESQANLSADGRTLLFCSNRPGAGGNSDIYVTKLQDEKWTDPINLGSTINTPSSDLSPFLASDGKTMYFSSSGHGGFGERDLFVTRRLDDSWTNWSEPVNLGRHINTLQSDEYLAVSSAGNIGYTVKDNSPDGYGDKDLYKFILPMNMRPEAVFNVYGNVVNEADSAAGVVLRYVDLESKREVAKASSDFEDGKYQVSLTPQRKYLVKVDMKGYLYEEQLLDLTDPALYLSKESIQDKMKEELPQISQLRKDYNTYLAEMDDLLKSDTNNIQGGFEDWKQLYTNLSQTSEDLEAAVNQARFRWMLEEDINWSLRVDHEVQRIRVGSKFELENIFFDLGKVTLSQDSKESLQELVDIMERSQIIIELGGHTDSIGTDENNLELSQGRVNTVRQYLVDQGISESRITAVGYGETLPIVSNKTNEGRQKNRRVEVKITEIAPREGSGEYEKEKKDETIVSKPISTMDLLEELQTAAQAGGVPKGSECSTELRYLPTGKDELYVDDTDYDDSKPKKASKSFTSLDDLGLDENVYKGFNIHLLNKGYAFSADDMLGVGVTFVKESNLREIHLDGFFLGNDETQWGARFGMLWVGQTNEFSGIPLSVLLGFNANVLSFQNNLFGDGNGTALKDSISVLPYVDLPLGLRYTLDVAGFVIAPEVKYAFNIYALQISDNDTKVKVGRFSVGANVRWKFLGGGLFLHMGDAEDYLGFRAGLSF